MAWNDEFENIFDVCLATQHNSILFTMCNEIHANKIDFGF